MYSTYCSSWAAVHQLIQKALIYKTLNPVYTIQPVVKPVLQPVASCMQTFHRLSNGLYNRFDNRLYRVNGALVILNVKTTWMQGSHMLGKIVTCHKKSLTISLIPWLFQVYKIPWQFQVFQVCGNPVNVTLVTKTKQHYLKQSRC